MLSLHLKYTNIRRLRNHSNESSASYSYFIDASTSTFQNLKYLHIVSESESESKIGRGVTDFVNL